LRPDAFVKGFASDRSGPVAIARTGAKLNGKIE